jgi:tyrosinase
MSYFGQAIDALRAKPISDPVSWRYQAARHEYRRAEDPFAKDPPLADADNLPPADQQNTFWNQCQHASYFFLPWHRMYLHYFERIVMGHVARLGGPKDWALPYWNYNGSTKFGLSVDVSARLPPSLRNPTGNPTAVPQLYIAQRDTNANAGQPFLAATDTDLSRPLTSTVFGGPAAFGGPVTAFSHRGGPHGLVESTPHDAVHAVVNGTSDTGFMKSFTRAPLDPVFWLHHCNIDRLWEVWVRRGRKPGTPAADFKNPTTTAWQSDVSFDFHDADGNEVSMTSLDVVDTKASPLQYEYDDTDYPL